ncbi:hypothetical protein Peur_017140 [Populus x canadensis]
MSLLSHIFSSPNGQGTFNSSENCSLQASRVMHASGFPLFYSKPLIATCEDHLFSQITAALCPTIGNNITYLLT